MRRAHFSDELLLRNALLLGADHDGGAVSVVGTDVNAAMTAHFLKPHPNICLQIFYQMTDVDRAIGIRQRRGYEDFSFV